MTVRALAPTEPPTDVVLRPADEPGGDAARRPAPVGVVGVGTCAELHAEQYAGMVRLAHLLVGSNAVAEELVQDAFLEVHRRWARIDNPAAYLRTTVVNRCRMHGRRRAVEQRYVPDPLRVVTDPELDETWVALARLSPRRRAALVLRFYADLPEAEIADALGCRPATVRSLVHRGLQQLRELLEP
jgi:RNA polymerase sigma-70 factor (sigma-E family)